LERSDNPGLTVKKNYSNPERVRCERNPFRVQRTFFGVPRVVAALQPWAEISNAFGVFFVFKLRHYLGVVLIEHSDY
jgi:hypothetical protein